MQDDTEVSNVEKPLGDPKRPTHSVCASCKQVKPLKDFKTMSTNAQAKSWGYNRAIEIISKNCKDCRRPRKKIAHLTLKEIQNKLASGDIKGGAYGNLIKKNKEDEIRRKRKESIHQRWHTIRAKEWAQLFADTTKEYNRVRKAKDHPDHSITRPELTTFYTEYHEAIVLVRSKLILEKKMGTSSPLKDHAWHSYIPPSKRADLQTLWEQIPAIHKQLIRQPEVFKQPQPKENHNESAT